MSYQIQYTETGLKRRIPHPVRNLLLCVGVCLSARIAIHMLGWDRLWQNLWIPGDSAVTAAAFDEMVVTIQSGQGIYDAFLEFCRTILNYG